MDRRRSENDSQPTRRNSSEYARRSASQRTRSSSQGRARTSSTQQNRTARQGRGAHSANARRSTSVRPAYSADSYNRRNYSSRTPQKRPFPIKGVILAIAIVLIVILAVCLVTKGCSSSESSRGEQAVQQGQAQQQQASQNNQTVPLEEGRVTMTLGGSQTTVVALGEEYIEAGCHVYDKEDGNITSEVQIEDNVDTSKVGEYSVTYTVKNSSNMVATKLRTVRVVDDMDKDTDGISVMMYHYVYEKGSEPANVNGNYVSTALLESHLKWLTKEGYYFPSYQELRAYVDGTHSLPSKSVVLTFDDGDPSFLKLGIPLLEKYKVPATSFIICSQPKAKKKITKFASEYVTFQSHSYNLHTGGSSGIGHNGRIYDLTEGQITKDLKKAQKLLGTTEAFAYPYGDTPDKAFAGVKNAGILCAFTTEYGQTHKGDNPYNLKRMRVFGYGDGSLAGFQYQVAHGAE